MSIPRVSALLVPRLKAVKQQRPFVPNLLALYPQSKFWKAATAAIFAPSLPTLTAATGSSPLSDGIDAEYRFIKNMTEKQEREIADYLADFGAKATRKLRTVEPFVRNGMELPVAGFEASSTVQELCDLSFRVMVRGLDECDEDNIRHIGVKAWSAGCGEGGEDARASDWKRVIGGWIIHFCLFSYQVSASRRRAHRRPLQPSTTTVVFHTAFAFNTIFFFVVVVVVVVEERSTSLLGLRVCCPSPCTRHQHPHDIAQAGFSYPDPHQQSQWRRLPKNAHS